MKPVLHHENIISIAEMADRAIGRGHDAAARQQDQLRAATLPSTTSTAEPSTGALDVMVDFAVTATPAVVKTACLDALSHQLTPTW